MISSILPTRRELDEAAATLCRRSFFDFIKEVKPDYEFNWHHLVLIEALERLARREIRHLIVMMPPRHGKSELVSILFPAWCFVRNSAEKIMVASYAASLAGRMSRYCQRIIVSQSFREMFPEIGFAKSKDEIGVQTSYRFDMVGGGGYIASGVGGGITGEGASIGISDDLVKNAEEADSVVYRDKTWEWYTSTFSTRLEANAVEISCATRWHEDDYIGRILELKKPGVEIICLTAICESEEENRNIGDPLWASRYGLDYLFDKQRTVGSRVWNALYQQRPSPGEGSIIKRQWFSYYSVRDFDIKGKRVNFYFDTSYTDKEKNDPTCGIAYVKIGADYYVLECTSEWLDFTAQIRFVEDFAQRNGYSPASIIRVEPKATGKTLVEVVKKQTARNVREAIAPKTDKVARVNSIVGVLESGRVFLPQGMAWVGYFLDECAAFPNGAHDDRVDCLSGMIINEENKPKFVQI